MYWLHTRKALSAASAYADLYTLPIPMLHHTPISICGLSIATLTSLSACAYVVTGEEWLRTRERVRIGLGAMKSFGSVWLLGRRAESETKGIARSVFMGERVGEGIPGLASGGCLTSAAPGVRNQPAIPVPAPWEGLQVDYSLLGDMGGGWEGMMNTYGTPDGVGVGGVCHGFGPS